MARGWRVGVVKDTARPMLGLHGLHVAFRGLPGVEIAGHVDANCEDLAGKLAVSGAARHYRTLEDLLAREAPDIVVLCSRHPGDHLAQIRLAAEAGCHVYCEKPLTASLREADEIVALAAQGQRRICVAHLARYALLFRAMKAMLAAGEIGTPLAAYARGKCDHRGGGEDLVVLGTHLLDLQTFLFGPPQSVFAEVTTGGRPLAATDRSPTVEPLGPVAGDQVFARFRFAGGVGGVFESRRGLSAAADARTCMGITVAGSEGALAMRFTDNGTRRLRISRQPGPPEDGACFEEVALSEDRVIAGALPLDYSLCGQPDIPATPYFLEANRFAAWDLIGAIEEGRPPVSSAEDARLALEMIYGIYASQLSGRLISFPLADRSHPLGEET